MTKLAIIGSRDFTDYDLLKEKADSLNPSIIISGGASGADYLAERYAKKNNKPIKIYHADWQRHGRAAGPIRNKEIVKNSDHILAFWDGESRGTLSSINLAKKYDVPCDIIYFSK